jgi:hypothetical protein
MASSPETSDWQKRYAVIEKVYCEGRWATVMEAGTLLLRELLEAGMAPEVLGLRHRTQLLMAHTLLHGYGDRDAAEDLYEVIRNSEAEPALRQMAEDGLDQCHQPLKSTRVLEEDEEEPFVQERPELFLPEAERSDLENEDDRLTVQPPPAAAQMPLRPLIVSPPEPSEAPEPPAMAADPFLPRDGAQLAGAGSGDTPVMPWLSQPDPDPTAKSSAEPMDSPLPWLEDPPLDPGNAASSLMRLIPDVVEEPELIEVHQVTPFLAEEVDLSIQAVAPSELISPPVPESEPEEDLDLRTGLLLVVVS